MGIYKFYISFFYIFIIYLYADSMQLANTDITSDSIYNSQPHDSLEQEVPLPKDPSILQMQEQQMDLMRKEYRGNPSKQDLIHYKQEEIKKQIQKDSTLKIKPEHTEDKEIIGVTNQYEFIINYIFKLVDDMPYGENYGIAVPIHSLYLHKRQKIAKVCEINTKETYLTLINYPHYTKTEMNASIRKQTQYLLYNLLQEYKTEVLECLILNQAHLDDLNTAINLEARTKTITSVRSYVLVDFHGGILTIKVFNPKDK